MLVAVTGATGFLGRYIVNHLVERGDRCRCWFGPASNRDGLAAGSSGIQWLPGRLNDHAATTALVKGVDAVVHAALERRGGWSPTDEHLLDFIQTNVVGSVRLMDAARQAGVPRFIFISTCAVHDVILSDRPLDEAHPLWPTSHYGAHKAAIEKFVHSFGLPGGASADQWGICALRPTGIYGRAQPVENSKWFSLIRDVVAGKPVNDPRGGKEVHAADVARAVGILLMTDPSATAGQSYNGYDIYVAAQDVAQIAKEASGSASVITGGNHGPRHQIDTSKLRALGMSFGGTTLLRRTVTDLVDAVKSSC